MKLLPSVLLAVCLASNAEAGSITLTPSNLHAMITGLIVGQVYTFTLTGCVQKQTCKQHETTVTTTDETDTDTDTSVTEHEATPRVDDGMKRNNEHEPSVRVTDGASAFKLSTHTAHTATTTTLFVDVDEWIWDCEFLVIEWDDPVCTDCVIIPSCIGCDGVTSVPEPGTFALVGLGLLLFRRTKCR